MTMNSEIEAVIQSLRSDADGKAALSACEKVEGWARATKTKELVELAAALEERCDPADQKTHASFEAVGDHVEDQLALVPGDAAVEAVFTLALRDRVRSVLLKRPRELRARALASRLGFGQTKETFLAALERGEERPDLLELLACWLQEVVLRGTALSKEARATRFAERLATAKHPLAELPLELCGTEREVPSYMPLYGDKGLGRAIETLASGPMSARTVPPPADGATVRVTRLEDEALAQRLETAVRPWSEGSKGKCEAKLFEISPPITSGLGSWFLRALPLDSTKGTARLDVTRAEDPAAVFGTLFSAASNGGAYSAGLGGAYGRRAAWASLGALVGAAPDATITQIDELAVRSAFLTFRAPGPWFYDVAWDLGVLALRPDGATAAVLAATDTE